jgi:hypothetical protein
MLLTPTLRWSGRFAESPSNPCKVPILMIICEVVNMMIAITFFLFFFFFFSSYIYICKIKAIIKNEIDKIFGHKIP